MTPQHQLQRKSFKLAALDVIKGALGSWKKTLRLVLIILAGGAAYGLYKAAVVLMDKIK